MITLYSGTPGSGKSVDNAKYLYDRIKLDNCVVIGNFEYATHKIKGKKRGKYIMVENDRLLPQRLEKFALQYNRHYLKGKKIKEGFFTLVIDEAQMLFNARDWQTPNRKAWLKFFTQHRKLGFDIILITQFDKMLDRQVRALIEYEEIHRKVNNYGTFGKILGLLCGGTLFVKVKMWYPMKQKVSSEFFIGRNKWYEMYDSHKIFDASKG